MGREQALRVLSAPGEQPSGRAGRQAVHEEEVRTLKPAWLEEGLTELRHLAASAESQLGYCTCSPTYGTVKAPALIGARQLRRHHSGGLSGSWRVPVYLLDPRADSCELVRAQGTGGSNGSDISITATRMDLPRQLQILSSSPSLSPGGSDLDTDDEAAAAAHR